MYLNLHIWHKCTYIYVLFTTQVLTRLTMELIIGDFYAGYAQVLWWWGSVWRPTERSEPGRPARSAQPADTPFSSSPDCQGCQAWKSRVPRLLVVVVVVVVVYSSSELVPCPMACDPHSEM